MDIEVKDSGGCNILSNLIQFQSTETPSDRDNNNRTGKSTLTMNLMQQKREVYLENNQPLQDDGIHTLPPPLVPIEPATPKVVETIPSEASSELLSTSDDNSMSVSESGSLPADELNNGGPETQLDAKPILDCTIVCNLDGSSFLVHPYHVTKVCTGGDFVCDSAENSCLPYPVNAKTLSVATKSGDEMMDHYQIFDSDFPDQSLPSKGRASIVLCIPCKLLFSSADKLIMHACDFHKLTVKPELHSRLEETCSSAMLYRLRGEPGTLCSLLPLEQIPIKKLIPSSNSTRALTSPAEPIHRPQPTRRTSSSSQFSSPLPKAVGCDEHPEGGIECPKCDIVLSSTRSLGGHMTMMHSRNSCKTLKCPKCNWHYKYQETLEIHMKEKHPDTEQTCIYCVTKQSHPKLARGESYMCGYKPYRCEVCNYSTTTKGNLSIHMQSDKHINNMQEFQNGATSPAAPLPLQSQISSESLLSPPPTSTPTTSASVAGSSTIIPASPSGSTVTLRQKQPQKNNWRCDVCNYETNIARNLRIHMTSEKHTHNMIILQQNVKSMQQNMRVTMNKLSMYPGQDPAAVQQQLGTMFPFDPMGIVGQIEALQSMGGDTSSDSPKLSDDISGSESKRSRDVYGCVICNAYTTDNLTQLEQHLTIDRSITTKAEHVTITPENHYLCNLCQYKTSLKANFQLHCKTDKHVQRIQLVNHIREGGQENEWRMRYLNMPNPVHIVCNVCTYQSNNIHKMRIHSLSPSHTIGASLFIHLRRDTEATTQDHYVCTLCTLQTNTKVSLVSHARQAHAAQMETMCGEGWKDFLVRPGSPSTATTSVTLVDNEKDAEDHHVKTPPKDSTVNAAQAREKQCPYCIFTTPTESILDAHISSCHESGLPCPLCSEKCTTLDRLEQHLSVTHNVSSVGAKRLLTLMDTSSWKSGKEEGDAEDWYRCQTCTKVFKDFDALCQHQSEQGHLEIRSTPRGPGFLCWKKGCNQYFKTAQALQIHFREIHAISKQTTDQNMTSPIKQVSDKDEEKACKSSLEMSDLKKCLKCDILFNNDIEVQNHMEISHNSAGVISLNEDKIPGTKFNHLDDEVTELVIDESASEDKDESTEQVEESPQTSTGVSHLHCELCDVSFAHINLMQAHVNSADHQTVQVAMNSKPAGTANLPSPIIRSEIAKRHDRPYKCSVCSVAYNQSKTLDVHLRSKEHRQASAKLTRGLSNQRDEAAAIESVPRRNSMIPLTPEASANDQADQSGTADVTTTTTASKDSHQINLDVEDIGSDQGTPSENATQMLSCQLCGSMFVSEDVLTQHQQLYCGGLPGNRRRGGAKRTHRQLLQNFGIECVMGFLETEQQAHEPETCEETGTGTRNTGSEEKENSIPEMTGKHSCSDCGQEFSGLWVLKAHKEDEHSLRLPENITEHFGNLYKEDFDAKDAAAFKAAALLAANTHHKPIQNSPQQQRQEQQPTVTKAAPSIKQEPGATVSNPMANIQQMMPNPMDLLSLQAAASTMPWLASLFPMGLMPSSMFPMMPGTSQTPSTNKPSAGMTPVMNSQPPESSNSIGSRPQQLQSNHNQASGEKRARTRISDDQLKVLRQYFDINNSPSEQSIMEMAEKTGLPAKVIKHWFRNTLFKERQRNKDSPYNFNNPPQTTLNLEEYEKTGRIPPEKSDVRQETVRQPTSIEIQQKSSSPNVNPTVPDSDQQKKEESSQRSLMEASTTPAERSSVTTTTESEGDMLSPSSPTPSSDNSNLYYDMFSSPSYKFTDYANASGSKRANRTRFTDHQIKTLQEYFEQNAYPKDEELENLSRLLRLPNRVIVVWFQNTRQKARKVYENAPSSSADVSSTSPTSKSSTYSCKKCGVSFNGYYDLIKHQKRICMKNDVVPLPFATDSQEKQEPSPKKMKVETPCTTNNGYSSNVKRPQPTVSSSVDPTLAANQAAAAMMSNLGMGSNTFMPGMPSPADMAKMMYGGAMNQMLMPFMPMPGMVMNSNAMQKTMKEMYDQSVRKMMDENQPKQSLTPTKIEELSSPRAESKQSSTSESARTSESPLDLSRVQKVIKSPEHSLSNHSTFTPQPQQDDSVSVGESDVTEELEDPLGNRVRSLSGGQSSRSQSKRYRTNLTSMQIHVMKNIFKQYKTPTMSECEVLGSFIGLQKRVVQVWFQNARAKEKKSRQAYPQAYSRNIEDDPLEEECIVCSVRYTHKCTLQDHLFSPRHILQVQQSFTGKLTEADRHAIRGQSERKGSLENSGSQALFGSRKSSEGNASTSEGITPQPQQQSNDRLDMQSSTRNLLGSMNPMSMMGLPGSMDLLAMMYPGMMPPMTGLGMMPGMADPAMMSVYNPLDLGTPLTLLQIPQSAIRAIGSKLANLDCTLASYTQDCMTLNDLAKEISHDDMQAVKTISVDVGYACRKCQCVFPRRDACSTHQAGACYVGKHSSSETMLKIEQQQFSCRACNEEHSTVQEYKLHCRLEGHKNAVTKWSSNNNEPLQKEPSAKRLRVQ